MSLILDLEPELERKLATQAEAEGLSLVDFATRILTNTAQTTGGGLSGKTGQVLIDASLPLRGLFTDEEIDEMFRRDPSPDRPVDLS